MTKRTPKPKGVPMPDLDYIECFWEEVHGTLKPRAVSRRITVEFVRPGALVLDVRAARKWLANPAAPKGVRR